MKAWLYIIACTLGINFSLSISNAQEEPVNDPDPVLISDEEAESLARRIERTLFANISLGTERLEGEQRYFGTVSGNISENGFVTLPYSATLTDDGRYEVMIGLWNFSEEVFEDPMPSRFSATVLSFKETTLLQEVNVRGVDIVSADLEIVIWEAADDIYLGLDAGGTVFKGDIDPEASADVRNLDVTTLFYDVAATAMWSPNETARVKLSAGWKKDGTDANEVSYRGERNPTRGRMDYSTLFLGLSADPGWTVFGRATELNAEYNFDTDMEIVVPGAENIDEVIYRRETRPALYVWLSVRTRR